MLTVLIRLSEKIIHAAGLKTVSEAAKLVPTGIVINAWEHRGWGDEIFFTSYEQRQLSGFYRVVNVPREIIPSVFSSNGVQLNPGKELPSRIQVGDEIRFIMNSGKIGRFIVAEIRYEKDPPDQFFARVEDIGYLEEPKRGELPP